MVIVNSHLLVIRRVHPRYGTFYVFPGGGIQDGERPAETLQRELSEETGLKTVVRAEVFTGTIPQGNRQHFYLADAAFAPVHLPTDAEENNPERQQRRGTYEPVWVKLADIPNLKLQPDTIKQRLLVCLREGFPDLPVDVGGLYPDRDDELPRPTSANVLKS
jgi:8-oxo-dGTP pyrophosphatase MutT (NUDIX family)